jgi:hypothetical protein
MVAKNEFEIMFLLAENRLKRACNALSQDLEMLALVPWVFYHVGIDFTPHNDPSKNKPPKDVS